jgi:two-component system sensor histidine kinase/response regulator
METKILVIEDNPSIRTDLLEMLEEEGYAVMGAENGRVGVQLAREFLPNLILCDIVMPEMDGHEVLAELRRDPATAVIPLIFLTALSDAAHQRTGMDLGADDYLSKPFTRAQLLRAVSARLDKHGATQAYFQRRLDELTRNIAMSLPHEFLTPLSTILTGSEILVRHHRSLQPDEIPQIAERVHTSAERLQRLIRHFLLYTSLELAALDPARAQALRGADVSPAGAVIADAALRAAEQAERRADLELELVEATVRMSGPNLGTLVEVLLDNAFKYSKAGTAVRVVGRVSNRVFTLSIVDHGRGLTAHQIAQVGAYVQFERERHEQQGPGLGLAIAKRLTELHGGEFSIESAPGRQTTVRVALPIQIS